VEQAQRFHQQAMKKQQIASMPLTKKLKQNKKALIQQ
jgi:hypothetical protein